MAHMFGAWLVRLGISSRAVWHMGLLMPYYGGGAYGGYYVDLLSQLVIQVEACFGKVAVSGAVRSKGFPLKARSTHIIMNRSYVFGYIRCNCMWVHGP